MLGFLVFLGSILSGIICSVYVNRILNTRKENRFKLSEDVKSELNNLLFEKSVALEALNKINQYLVEKKIDVYEKDRLLLKYGKLLDHYDDRILKIQPIIEMQDIYAYRKQLYSLISDSITKLDEKLSNFSNNSDYIQHNNKKDDKNKNKLELYSIPSTQKIVDNTSDTMNSSIDHLSYFENSREKDLDSLNTVAASVGSTETHATFSSIAKNTIDENDKNDDLDCKKNNVFDTKKDNFEDFTVDEINKIQKDVLKILQRLENTSA
jgi:hypothetical protein